MKAKKILNPSAIINQLKKQGKAFFIFQTLYTKKIFTEDKIFSYTQKTDLKKSDLLFIRQIKLHAATLENIPRLTASDVHYIEKSEFLKEGEEFTNCYEIDLNAAFWNFAFEEKFLSEPLYEKGLMMPKKTRLISLGALAKKITVMKFDGAEFAPIEFVRSEKTQGVFFRVAQLTSFLMQELKFIADRDFLFFWCDAIFVRNKETYLKLCEYLQAMHYAYKDYFCEKINFENGVLTVQSKEYSEKHPQKNYCTFTRPFTFDRPKPKNNTHKFFNSPKKRFNEKRTEKTAPEEETPF